MESVGWVGGRGRRGGEGEWCVEGYVEVEVRGRRGSKSSRESMREIEFLQLGVEYQPWKAVPMGHHLLSFVRIE